ncbi:glutathione peroxidase [Stutzerimonas chloritidismutans]|jgi:glutathione peroxidase|uniref:glutathione peroxidase n=1 Tax=Stutzerimonas stutzeri subgroup TaxID=578833 RepID=UPI0006277E48|nr:glutathione peroxidase [Stutzerimonas kunmingensis]KKJ94016.1 glutathione peroxidase [Stutzerimonas stutzeri]HAG77523.1 glutathione peroxidase [Pseudomonas sp.]|tara:strand:+ start:136 stop:618 length:483 start_codon:yes stop_codon:yes gene_type:complete
MHDPLLDIPCVTIEGEQKRLADFDAKVLLVVNTASQCGFTPQYKGLEALWQRYGERGLIVLGFPCNQFGKQEPDGEQEIAAFCEHRFGVSFPLFAKVEVNGGDAHPLFIELKKRAPGLLGSKAIKWNFTKFLISDQGRAVRRFSSRTTPEAMAAEIETLL